MEIDNNITVQLGDKRIVDLVTREQQRQLARRRRVWRMRIGRLTLEASWLFKQRDEP